VISSLKLVQQSVARFVRGVVSVFLALGLAGTLRAAFEIVGSELTALAGETVTISRQSLENRTESTVAAARVTNGHVQLRVEGEPGLYSLRVGNLTAPFVAGQDQTLRVAVAPDGKNLWVSGARDQELFMAYESFRVASLARNVVHVDEVTAAQPPAGKEAEIARLTDAEVAGTQAHRRELNDFTLEKLRGSPALYAASLRWDGNYRLDELAEVVKEFSRQAPDLEIAQLMEQRVQRFRDIKVGAEAPALAGTSPTGAAVSLASLRGRYVLVDFWASWCAPCRVENRNYAELYRRYRSAGFEILAVSVDESASAWKAAIAKDNAMWLQLSDLKGWKSPLVGAYNVTGLPASFLLDPQGRVIARDLRGKDLADRLASLLPTAGTKR
jgi:peroxiredoxin